MVALPTLVRKCATIGCKDTFIYYKKEHIFIKENKSIKINLVMDRQAIFNEIAKDFNVRWAHSKGLNVDFMDFMLDPYHYPFVAVLLMDDRTVLTDLAETAQIVDFTPEQFKEICAKHNIDWDDYNMECEYHTNKDILRFKECLMEIAELNWKKFGK